MSNCKSSFHQIPMSADGKITQWCQRYRSTAHSCARALFPSFLSLFANRIFQALPFCLTQAAPVCMTCSFKPHLQFSPQNTLVMCTVPENTPFALVFRKSTIYMRSFYTLSGMGKMVIQCALPLFIPFPRKGAKSSIFPRFLSSQEERSRDGFAFTFGK